MAYAPVQEIYPLPVGVDACYSCCMCWQFHDAHNNRYIHTTYIYIYIYHISCVPATLGFDPISMPHKKKKK